MMRRQKCLVVLTALLAAYSIGSSPVKTINSGWHTNAMPQQDHADRQGQAEASVRLQYGTLGSTSTARDWKQGEESRYLPAITSKLANPAKKTHSQSIFADWSFKGPILIDVTPYSDWQFSLSNYRALESLLMHYPNATYRGLLLAGPDILRYKFANSLSMHQFQKYQKRGYDIQMLPLSAQARLDSFARDFCRWLGRGNPVNDRKTEHRLRFFESIGLRLLAMSMLGGGISLDLAHLMIHPFPKSLRNGYHFRRHCWNPRPSIASTSYQPPLDMFMPQAPARTHIPACNYAAVMVMQGHDAPAVIECAMKQMRSSAFSRCTTGDSIHTATTQRNLKESAGSRFNLFAAPYEIVGLEANTSDGFHCVEAVLAKCFADSKIVNEMQAVDWGAVFRRSSSSEHHLGVTGLPDWQTLILDGGYDHDLARSLGYSESQILKQDQEYESLYGRRPSNVLSSTTRASFLETFWDNVTADADHHRSPSLVWLGPRARMYEWDDLHHDTILGRLFERIQLERRSPFQTDARCQLPCVPRSVDALRHVQAAEQHHAAHSCAIHFVVPGIMKASTSFLFDAIAHHPQVLNPLKGFQYKETGYFLQLQTYQARTLLDYFPFIEHADNMVTGDGTVYYMTNRTAARLLHQANPRVKLVAAVRHPAIRFYSHWAYMYHGFKSRGLTNFNVHAWNLMKRDALKHLRRPLGSNGTQAIVDPMPFYQRSVVGDAFYGMSWSAYVYPIKFLMDTFGRENVMVVSAEELSPSSSGTRVPGMRSQLETLRAIYEFLGLCPIQLHREIGEKFKTKLTGNANERMTNETFTMLSQYFGPLNRALYELIGRDLLWDEMKMG